MNASSPVRNEPLPAVAVCDPTAQGILDGQRMRYAILAIIPFLALKVLGQPAVVRGTVIDDESGQGLQGAHVSIIGSPKGAISGAGGHFSLELLANEDQTLRATYTGYAERTRRVTAQEIKTGEHILLRLNRKAFALGPAEVRAAPAPEVVFQRADLHVGGYLVNDDGAWVLGYSKPQLWHSQSEAGDRVMRGPRLVLLDSLFREVASTMVGEDARALHRDHSGHPVIEGREHGWVAKQSEEGIRLDRIDRRTLQEAVLPWTDSLGDRLFGNNRSEQFPAYEHFARDLATGKDHLLCAVQDDFMMELFRSQYKYMSGPEKVIAMDLEIETGIDREIIAGFMTGFHKDLYFKVPRQGAHHALRGRRVAAGRDGDAPPTGAALERPVAAGPERRPCARAVPSGSAGMAAERGPHDGRSWRTSKAHASVPGGGAGARRARVLRVPAIR